jgi:predicted transcriptional regulator of viral defense system
MTPTRRRDDPAMPPGKTAPSKLPDRLLGEGRYWITAEQAADLLDRPKQTVYPRLAELQDAGKLFSPAKGLYVVVPPDYRNWGVVPAEWFIDPLMRHLKRAYYVAFLSAASRHGSAAQAPQTFQVVVDRTVEDRKLGRVRLHFVKRRGVEDADREQLSSHTGTYCVATREMTAVDLAWRPREGGGMSNVATVLRGFGELDGERMARLASTRGRGTARRLGWLMERFRPDVEVFWLSQVARPAEGSPAVLVPGNEPRGPVDRTWGLRLNGVVEPD